MSFFKKHVDAAVVIGVVISAAVFMTTQFKDIRSDFREEFKIVHADIGGLKKEINCIKEDMHQLKTEMSVMKTVLIMQKIMPHELALKEEK